MSDAPTAQPNLPYHPEVIPIVEVKRHHASTSMRELWEVLVRRRLLIAAAHLLIKFTVQHGAFGSSDTAVVTKVLVMYSIQVPFFVRSRVYFRFIVAMRRTDLILYCGTINLGLDVVLNLVLMRWFGVAGIALATSLWTISTFLFLWYWSRRLLAQTSRSGSAA